MKLYISSIISLLLICIFSSCTDPQNKSGASRFTMREDSELTLLMRDMYDYYDSLKVNIENGDIPDNIKEFHNIHSAISTEPAKAKSDLYQAMATVYKESADRLKNNKNDISQSFNLMVDNCMNCHQQMCPGPMVKIKNLYLTDAKLER